MPYRTLQGGTAQRRRRPPRGSAALLVLVLAAVGVLMMPSGAGDHGHAHHRAAVPPTAAAAALDSGTAPVAGGGPTPSPLAVKLDGPNVVRMHLRHPPRSGLLFDLDSGRVLWRRAPTRVVPIASLTKMMTALVVVDRLGPHARVPITKQALAYRGSGVGLLPRGKRIRVRTMLYGLLLPSGNDAAIALAQRAGGTVRRFVRLMNARARALGLTCTRFSTPSGFEDAAGSCLVATAQHGRRRLGVVLLHSPNTGDQARRLLDRGFAALGRGR